MANFQTIPWGNTQIRYFPSRMAEEDVKQAAGLVSPSFVNMQDSFVVLGTEGQQVVAAIPTKPQPKVFQVPIHQISVPEAIRQALQKAANFLKGRA